MQNKKKNERSKHNIQRRTGNNNKSHSTRKSNKKKEILTDSFNILMAIEGNGDTRNPKTRILRTMLPEEGEKVSLV
jgi:hypothetical protein